MAHAERVDETLQRNPAPLPDGGKEIAHGRLAVALDFLQLQLRIALGQREDVRGLLHPAFIEEVLKLLLAEAVDVEGAARHEQFQMLDLLVRTGELAAAAEARSLLARRRLLAHHVGAQRARTLPGEMEFPRTLR